MINLIGEIGINHNGDLDLVEEMIRDFHAVGVNYFKLQKRTPEVCVPESQKDKPKKVPWRNEPTTYLQYKQDIEFGYDEYEKLYRGVATWFDGIPPTLFASVWDIESARFMENFTPWVKIPSAKITDHDLLEYCRDKFAVRILSTGMSTEEEIEDAVEVFDPTMTMHTNSSYPTHIEDARLENIRWLKEKYFTTTIGYSNHCPDPLAINTAAAMGCKYIEVHITPDKTMWGSDQQSSFDPSEINEVVANLELIDKWVNGGLNPRRVYKEEISKRESLRGN